MLKVSLVVAEKNPGKGSFMGIEFFKKTWFTSDWHVGHDNVLSFCSDSRGHFRNLEEMHESLINNYNSVVGENQVCYFLGDFAFKGTGYGKGILDQLKGKKILVRGNHDKGHQALVEMGFDSVVDSLEWKIGGLHITASHFPLRGLYRERCEDFRSYQEGESWHGEYKYTEKFLTLENKGQDIHLHGHLHSPNKGRSKKILGKQYDVGVDANNLTPISLNSIIKQLKRKGGT